MNLLAFNHILIYLCRKIIEMEKHEKKSGGKRIGAGRKAATDKIKPIYIGLRESVIAEVGGKETVKLKAEHYINNLEDFQYIGETL